MADESTVKINIVTAGDAAGAQKIEQEMQKVAGAAKQVTAASKEVSAANPWASASAGKDWRPSPQLIQQMNDLDKGQVRVAQSGRNMGNALLQGSRAIQDMQYGLAGAVNNLEGIASALGMGAGVAGVVTVLAVAFQQLGPAITNALASLDVSKIKTDGLRALQEQLNGVIQVKDSATRAAEKLAEAIARENEAVENSSQVIDRNLDLLTRRNKVADEAGRSKLDSDIADIQAQKLPKEEAARRIADLKSAELNERFTRGRSEAEGRVSAAAQKSVEAAKAFTQAGSARQEAEETLRRTAALNEVLEQQSQIVDQIAEARRRAAAIEAGSRGQDRAGIAAAQEKVAELERQEKALEQRRGQIWTSGRIGVAGELKAEVEKRREEEKLRAKELIEADKDFRQTRENEQINAQGRVAEFRAEQTKIARETAPGVYNPANMVPGRSPLDSPRLDDYRPGVPRGLPQPVPPLNLRGNSPLDNAPADLTPLNEAAQGVQAGIKTADIAGAAQSIQEMGQAVVEAMNMFKTLRQEVQTLKQQVANSRN